MATNNTIQTINISSQNIYGDCDLKCSYNYKYNQSNSVATNNGVFISLSYDKGTTSPVLYNNQKYYVSKINIYNPSLHMFNNNSINAELVIEHAPEMGGELLYTCIPIIESTNSSDASNILSQIIQSVATNAPTLNESTNLNISNFNLDIFVPKKPFFSYTGSSGLIGQVIVFGINYAIPMNPKILDVLKQIIKPYPITISGGNVFFNKNGPNNIQVNDGIYISCQPTGSSSEETQVTYSTPNTNYNLGSVYNNSTFNSILQIIIGCILFIIILYLLNSAYNYLTSPSTKLPSLKLPMM